MPRKRTTIDNYSLQHFVERAQERYGTKLNDKDFVAMNGLIKGMKEAGANPLSSEKDTEIHRVTYNGVDYVCVWHKTDSHITTLLPKDTVVRKRK